MKRVLLALTMIVGVASRAVAGTVLGDAAASLTPGRWVKLNPSPGNQDAVLNHTNGSSDYIFGYSHTIAWDSVQKRLFYQGGDHGFCGQTAGPRFVYYDDLTNSWAQLTRSPYLAALCTGAVFHGYDHSTVAPGRSFFWNDNYTLLRYDFGTQTWSQADANAVLFNNSGYQHSGNAGIHATYFPDRNSVVMSAYTGEPGGVTGAVWEYRLSNNTWALLGTVSSLGQHLGIYNPVDRTMLIYETGIGKMWKVAANGAITQLGTAPPIDLGPRIALTAVDPVSGQYLVMRGYDGTGPGSLGAMYSYDPRTNLWRKLPGDAPPSLPADGTEYGVHGAVVAAISTYGVIAVVRPAPFNDIWIYKHNPNAGTVLSPTVTLTASPPVVAIGEATTLDWTTTNAASCTASGAWSGTKATSGTETSLPLRTNATFTLTCTGPGGANLASTLVENSNCPDPLPADNPGVIHVGPLRRYKNLSEAAAALNDGTIPEGSIIDIDACTYRDSAVLQKSATLRGFGGKARIRGTGGQPLANGKALILLSNFSASKTWVLEDLEISNAESEDGTGIRTESAANALHTVVMRRLYVHHNGEHGVSGVYGNFLMEFSELAYNAGSCHAFGQCHNIYLFSPPDGDRTPNIVGTFQHNYSHHAIGGHNFKGRNHGTMYVLYNRLMDEATGNSSYAIDTEVGGVVYVIGNLLQVGPRNANVEFGTPFIVNFGTGAAGNPTNKLWFVNNTLVNDASSNPAVFLRIRNQTQAVKVINNVFVGPKFTGGGAELVEPGILSDAPPTAPIARISNVTLNPSDLVDAVGYNYRLRVGAPAIGAGTDPGNGDGVSLMPTWQYVHPASREPRVTVGPIDAGAYQGGTSDTVPLPPRALIVR